MTLCIGLLATAAAAQPDIPYRNDLRALRQSTVSGDASEFSRLLDRIVPQVFNDPNLTVETRLQALGGFLAMARRLGDPDAGIGAEEWLLVYAEVALGTAHEVTVASRARLVTALIVAGRLDEARMIAAEGPTAPDGRSILKPIIALQLLQAEDFEAAVPLLEAELQDDIQLTGPDNPDRVSLLHMLGEALLGAGDPKRAIEVLEPAARWADQGLYPPETRAMTRLLFGRALSAANRHDDAKALLTRALDEAEQTLGPLDRTSLMLGLVLANAHGAAGEFQAYTTLRLRQAELARRANLHPAEMAATLAAHADSLALMGQYEQAEPVLRDLVALADQSPGIDPATGIRARQRLADVLLQIDPLGEGRDLRIDVADRFQALLGPDHIETLRARADVVMTPGPDTAIDGESRAAVRALLAAGTGRRARREVLAKDLAALQQVTAALRGGDLVRPVTAGDIDTLRRLAAAETARSEEPTFHAARARANLASLLLRARDYPGAMAELDTLIAALDNDGADELRHALGPVLSMRAQALSGMGRHADAVAAYDRALERDLVSRRWLQSIANPLSRDRPQTDDATGWRLASAAWEAAANASPADAARLRAQAFRAIQMSGLGPAAEALALAETRRLKQDPEAAAAIAAWEDAAERTVSVRDSLAFDPTGQADTGLDAAEARLMAIVPDFYDRLIPEPLGWDGDRSLRSLLSDDEVLVLIVPAPLGIGPDEDPSGFVFAATRDRLAWARLPLSTRDLSLAIGALHGELDRAAPVRLAAATRAPVDPGSAPARRASLFDTSAAHALYNDIFGAPEIAALLSTRNSWILVPFGIAMSLPYAPLVMTPPDALPTDAAALRRVDWLGLNKSLTVLPAVSALRARETGTKLAAEGMDFSYVGFGDPVFTGRPNGVLRPAGSGSVASVGSLPRLPGTGFEIRQIAGMLGEDRAMILLGSEASEQAVDRLFGTGSPDPVGIVHFATHGLLAGDLPGLGEPALALSPPAATAGPGSIAGMDGLLTASEIAALRLPAEWVILSACDTSGSADPAANLDGLSGLVRAFLLAGAQGMLVSHWRVEDEIAVRLTTETVKAMLAGAARPDALRQAMADIAADTSRDRGALPMSHPMVWAPFFLVGQD